MEPVLFLVHRIPFPPNKGDKVRSFHLLKFLASRYRVHLGTFVDDRRELAYASELQRHCASHHIAHLAPIPARIRSLASLWTGESLTERYYRDSSMAAWVNATLSRNAIGKVVVFSSAMAQYVRLNPDLRVVVDFVDVDSSKWVQYGTSRRWPLSSLFKREGERLLAFERAVAKRAYATVFVTPGEAELFRSLAPESASRVYYARNGVDVDYFSPQPSLPNPFSAGQESIVFTGAMDYWPNVDAVTWFAGEILPLIAQERPNASFHIVGANPVASVRALTRDRRVFVSGRVEDVRPYLQHSRVVVAPMRIARGIQNKVLEAMAMARPVVVAAGAAKALSALAGRELDIADGAVEFGRKTIAAMDPQRGAAVGTAARARVVADYDWSRNLAPFDSLLRDPAPALCHAAV
ncbi:MAG TPA: TIGR03087 family PEP-CTERM/XrtA system glycosyltransferase [Casimicrobiaceae bacterium]|nr:TIGR03087 family PEP-CTERM/XrtA system glycosyltransferase [Casimicrobiaceae bacterium]